MRPRAAVWVVALAACASDASFDVRYANDYAKPASVSIFGVFKDGRMNQAAWDALGARFSAPLHGVRCEILFGEKLAQASPDLAPFIDDYTRRNGVTDDVLDKLAPLAMGDSVLLITIAGHPPQSTRDGGAPPPQQSPSPMSRGAGRRGRGMGAPYGGGRAADTSVYEVSASLFSVKTHHAVGLIGMTYSGASVDEALKKFTDKLGTELGGATCAGWDASRPLDADQLKRELEAAE